MNAEPQLSGKWSKTDRLATGYPRSTKNEPKVESVHKWIAEIIICGAEMDCNLSVLSGGNSTPAHDGNRGSKRRFQHLPQNAQIAAQDHHNHIAKF